MKENQHHKYKNKMSSEWVSKNDQKKKKKKEKKYRKGKTESINLSQNIGGGKPLLKIGTGGG
jgi:hypothetical protein